MSTENTQNQKKSDTCFLDRALILTAATTIIFLILDVIIFVATGSEPESAMNTLKDIVMVELGGGGIIQIAKARRKRNEQSGISCTGEEYSEEF